MTKCSILFLMCVISVCGQRLVEAKLSISLEPNDALFVMEGEEAYLKLNISGLKTSLILEVTSSDPSIFTVQGNVTFYLYFDDDSPLPMSTNDTTDDISENVTITIIIKGEFVGIEGLLFSVSSIGTPYVDPEGINIPSCVVKVTRKPNFLVDAFNYMLLVWLVFSYISMGATMDWKAIWDKLRRPYGVIVGLLCQFVIMPLLAFSLAKLLRLDKTAALGLIIVGCCPGGWVSNIYSLLLDCDLVLSITMTTCSTILALGTMPANLFIYGTPFTTDNESITIPWQWTILQILMLIFPVLFGMLLYYKAPKVAKVLGRFLRAIASIMIIIGLAFGLPANLYAFYAPLNIVFVAFLLPVIGSVLGLLLAKASCLYNTSAVTVALETGAQNTLLGALVSQFSFPQPEADLISRIPLIVAMLTIGYGALVTLVYVLFNKCPGKVYAPIADENECETCGKTNNVVQEVNGSENVDPLNQTPLETRKKSSLSHENNHSFSNDEIEITVQSNGRISPQNVNSNNGNESKKSKLDGCLDHSYF